MGNQQTQFQIQFYNRYSFIQNVEDRNFGSVKVYRKNTFRYDYIMVSEILFEEQNQGEIDVFFNRLERVKSLQNQLTMRLFHHKVINEGGISCQSNKLIIFSQYLNRNLNDYLSALRSNPLFSLEVQEIIYILKQTAKSALILKRMGINKFTFSVKNIFLSIDGQIVLCPLLFLLQSLIGSITEQQISVLQKNYQKYSVTHLMPIDHYPEKRNFKSLLLELSGNLHPTRVRESNFLYKIIQQSKCLQHLYSTLPETYECENVRIDQMYKGDNLSGQFYNTD